MVLETGLIPPNFDFQCLNPKIDAEYLGIKIPERISVWPSEGLRRASVNSFGFGGSNSHVVLDDVYNYLRTRGLCASHRTVAYPRLQVNGTAKADLDSLASGSASVYDESPESSTGIPQTLLFSADTEQALDRVLSSYQKHFMQHNFSVKDVSYTLDSRRTHLTWRSTLTVTSPSDFEKLASRSSLARKVHDKEPRLGFVFTGQGAQWFGMGRELMLYPTFAESVRKADKHLQSLGCPWSASTMFTSLKKLSIDDPTSSQTLCTVLQVALVDLLERCGVSPAAVVGHSSGEIAAAYASGAISKQAAWSLAYHRGFHAQTLPSRTSYRGCMIAVGLSEAEVQLYLDQVIASSSAPWDLRVACYNSPRSVTVSGPSDQIGLLKTFLDVDSIFNRVLRVSVAYHSPQMEVIADDYLDSIGTMAHQNSHVPMVSSVTGQIATAKQLQRGQYWVDNMVSPVRFDEAVEALCSVSPKALTKKLDQSHVMTPAIDLLVEIGPHAALKGPVLDILKRTSRATDVEYDFAISRNVSATQTVHQLLGRLHCRGVNVSWRQVNDPATTPRAVVTDLPYYPFDRSQTFWSESRINKDLRLREHGHREFLGSRSLDWCPLAPQWRYFIRTNELPWTKDHKINGSTLYPASGMLVMAAEAARQLVSSARAIEGYQFRNVKFSTALNIPSSREELESQITLRHLKDSEHGFEYVLYSVQGENSWVENSRGEIQVYLKAATDTSHALLGTNAMQETFIGEKGLGTEVFYQYLWEMGYGYGPTFQLVQDIRYDASYNKVLGQIKPLVTPVSEDSIVHPATLDAILHLEFAVLFKAGSERPGTFIPTKIDSLWMSNKGLNSKDVHVNVVTTVQSRTKRHTKSSCQVFSDDYGQTLLKVDGMELTMVASSSNESMSPPGSEHILSYVCSKVDVDLMNAEQLKSYLAAEFPTTLKPVAKRKTIRYFILLSLQSLHKQLEELGTIPSSQHGRAFVGWAESMCQGPDVTLPNEGQSDIECEVLKHGAEGRLIVEIHKTLLNIILGRHQSHELLSRRERLLQLYCEEKAETEVCFKRLVHYISLLAFKRPNLRILEIGGGTGTFTSYILDALSIIKQDGAKHLRCASYDFTDSDPALLDQAATKFAQYSTRMVYNVLDIAADPDIQGFQKEAYDIVIAVSVPQATRDLGQTLKNTRRLLKPGGKLILHENTTPEDSSHLYAFGVSPNWWLGIEESRRQCPLADQLTWDRLMRENGFTGTDIVMRDYEDDDAHQMDFLISHAAAHDASNAIADSEHQVSLIVLSGSTVQRQAAEVVQTQLHTVSGLESKIVALTDLVNMPAVFITTCISLLDFDGPFITDMSEEQYDGLQQLLKKARLLLWVSRGGGYQPAQPGFQMIDGFARSFRLEATHLKLVHLALEPAETLRAVQAESIVRIFGMTSAHEQFEHEITEKGGRLHVQRVVPQPILKEIFLDRMQPQRTIQRPIPDTGCVSLVAGVSGNFETLAFSIEPGQDEPLAHDEVEVRVQAVSLGHEDLRIVNGLSEVHGFGRNCAGVVTRVGNSCKLQAGQRVWMHASGTCRSLTSASMHSVVALPDDVSLEQICALPDDVVTAAHALHVVARLEANSSVLLDCSGSLLRAMLHCSRSLGVNVFVLAASLDEKLEIEEESELPARNVLVSTTPLQYQFRTLNGGRGADAVISTRVDSSCSEVLTSFGSYIRIANESQSVGAPSLADNATFTNLNIAALATSRPNILQPALQIAVDTASKTKQETASIFPSSDLASAFKRLDRMASGERVVLTFNSSDVVQVHVPQQEAYTLSDNGTYVVTGAFGGLGSEVLRWLVRKGAKHLILLSRSGPRTEVVLRFVSELKAQGIALAMPNCDVTDAASVQMAIRDVAENMPPIRGCLHLAVSGKDKSFEAMSYHEWVDRTSAKVQGTHNIHAALPSDMDFFIMTASVGGMAGLISMSAYSAGNAYQDSFARYLHGKGQKAVAIDYGAAQDIGMLAGQDLMYNRLIQTGQYTPVTERELLALLEYYCDPATSLADVESTQPIIGIEPPGRRLAQGKEVPEGMKHALWAHLYDLGDASSSSPEAVTSIGPNARAVNLIDAIAATPDVSEAEILVVEALVERVAKTTSVPAEKMDHERPIHSYGVDSLTAIDLRNWISRAFEYDIAVFEILGEATFKGVAATIARKLKVGK